jgi:acetamidase/formamidase
MRALVLFFATATLAQQPATHQLKAGPKTVVWGYYSASAPPALRVRSGDTVEIETLITNSPARLEAAGVAPDQIEPALRAIYKEVTDKDRRAHSHRPVYIEGAEPGDTLGAHQASSSRSTRTTASDGFGFLPDEFPYSRIKIVPRPGPHGGAFSDRIEIPLRPFFGSMGVAPPGFGPIRRSRRGSTRATWTTKKSWSPARCSTSGQARGALFEVGDGHAAQGNGGRYHGARNLAHRRFQFIVRGTSTCAGRVAAPTHYITMGCEFAKPRVSPCSR